MKEFRIDIYNQTRDEKMRVQAEYCIYSALYETNESIESIVDSLHKGEGLAIELIQTDDEIPLIRFENLFGEGDRGVIEGLKQKCNLLSENQSDFKTDEGSDFILSIEGELSEQDVLALQKFIDQKFSIRIYSSTKTISIYEWGASGFFVDFILNLAAGLSHDGLKKIHEFLKSKGHDHAEVNLFDIKKVKQFLEINFDINPQNLKLISTRTYEDGKTRLTFSSRYIDYHITIDKESNIIESKVRKLNQTGV